MVLLKWNRIKTVYVWRQTVADVQISFQILCLFRKSTQIVVVVMWKAFWISATTLALSIKRTVFGNYALDCIALPKLMLKHVTNKHKT